MKIHELAEIINGYCNSYKCFWAYGLVKETISLWHNDSNRNLLCSTAKIMYEQVCDQG